MLNKRARSPVVNQKWNRKEVYIPEPVSLLNENCEYYNIVLFMHICDTVHMMYSSSWFAWSRCTETASAGQFHIPQRTCYLHA